MRSIGQGNRLGTAIYADTSDPHRLSVGLIGGDIPIFSPFAFLLSIGMALMLWSLTHKRYRIVPSHSLYMRGATMAVGVALAVGLANAVEVELIRIIICYGNMESKPILILCVYDVSPLKWSLNRF